LKIRKKTFAFLAIFDVFNKNHREEVRTFQDFGEGGFLPPDHIFGGLKRFKNKMYTILFELSDLQSIGILGRFTQTVSIHRVNAPKSGELKSGTKSCLASKNIAKKNKY